VTLRKLFALIVRETRWFLSAVFVPKFPLWGYEPPEPLPEGSSLRQFHEFLKGAGK